MQRTTGLSRGKELLPPIFLCVTGVILLLTGSDRRPRDIPVSDEESRSLWGGIACIDSWDYNALSSCTTSQAGNCINPEKDSNCGDFLCTIFCTRQPGYVAGSTYGTLVAGVCPVANEPICFFDNGVGKCNCDPNNTRVFRCNLPPYTLNACSTGGGGGPS
jgi:hypothetical protein